LDGKDSISLYIKKFKRNFDNWILISSRKETKQEKSKYFFVKFFIFKEGEHHLLIPKDNEKEFEKIALQILKDLPNKNFQNFQEKILPKILNLRKVQESNEMKRFSIHCWNDYLAKRASDEVKKAWENVPDARKKSLKGNKTNFSPRNDKNEENSAQIQAKTLALEAASTEDSSRDLPSKNALIFEMGSEEMGINYQEESIKTRQMNKRNLTTNSGIFQKESIERSDQMENNTFSFSEEMNDGDFYYGSRFCKIPSLNDNGHQREEIFEEPYFSLFKTQNYEDYNIKQRIPNSQDFPLQEEVFSSKYEEGFYEKESNEVKPYGVQIFGLLHNQDKVENQEWNSERKKQNLKDKKLDFFEDNQSNEHSKGFGTEMLSEDSDLCIYCQPQAKVIQYSKRNACLCKEHRGLIQKRKKLNRINLVINNRKKGKENDEKEI